MAPKYVTALLEAQNHNCCYCHHEMPVKKGQQTIRNEPTKDHVEPRCHGGLTKEENLVMACAQCNQIRGAMDAVVFYDLLWYWFKTDPTLRSRWHSITRVDVARHKNECSRIHRVQWHRRLKKCAAAALLHQQVPLPFLKKHQRI
jgi:hypothetical protein